MARRKYTATFENGVTIKRSSERSYSHAWLVVLSYPERVNHHSGSVVEAHESVQQGFSGSHELARKALGAAIAAWGPAWTKATVKFSGVAPAQEV